MVPVDVAAQTITSVTMDPINGVIYYATLDTFGIHRVNLTGWALKCLWDHEKIFVLMLYDNFCFITVFCTVKLTV